MLISAIASRYSFKLLFDQASLGPIESPEDLFSTLEDYERNWYIGLVTENGWHSGVLQEKPFLFSLGQDLSMVTALYFICYVPRIGLHFAVNSHCAWMCAGYLHRTSSVPAGAAGACGPPEWRRCARSVGQSFLGASLCH